MNSNVGRMSRRRYPPSEKNEAPPNACENFDSLCDMAKHAAEGAALFRPTCNL